MERASWEYSFPKWQFQCSLKGLIGQCSVVIQPWDQDTGGWGCLSGLDNHWCSPEQTAAFLCMSSSSLKWWGWFLTWEPFLDVVEPKNSKSWWDNSLTFNYLRTGKWTNTHSVPTRFCYGILEQRDGTRKHFHRKQHFIVLAQTR
jgi:hypothetical protein